MSRIFERIRLEYLKWLYRDGKPVIVRSSRFAVWIYIDRYGQIWKLKEQEAYYGSCPLEIMLLDRG